MLFFTVLLLAVWAQILNHFQPGERSPPDPRAYSCLFYIPSRGLLLTFGGFTETEFISDVWTYDLQYVKWTEVFPDSDILPCISYTVARSEYGAFISLLNEKIYIFGGKSAEGLRNDFIEYNHESLEWRIISTKNTPKARRAFAYTYYIEDGIEYFAIFGGESSTGVLNDLIM